MIAPLIAAEFVAGACVAAGAVLSAAVAPELFAGFALFVAAAVALAVAAAFDDDDDEADAVDVTPDPAIGAPAIFIALVDPN